jgi:hypothetical protein
VKVKKQLQTLYKLATASLISEAEFDNFSSDLMLKSPISIKKFSYLEDILRESNLNSYIKLDPKKEQFTIHSHTLLQDIKKQWYIGNSKIFSKILDPGLIDIQTIVICINLFGTRKSENITIPTSIVKDQIKGVSFCIEQHLKVPIIPSSNSIKITNLPLFIGSILKEVPTIHSTELINFLTDKEKKKIAEGAFNK